MFFLTSIMPYTGNECCERLAYYGIDTNLVTYLTGKLHQGNVSAAKNVNIWAGTCYFTPLIGATLADAYWGRYWTIFVFSTIYFIVIMCWTQYFYSLTTSLISKFLFLDYKAQNHAHISQVSGASLVLISFHLVKGVVYCCYTEVSTSIDFSFI